MAETNRPAAASEVETGGFGVELGVAALVFAWFLLHPNRQSLNPQPSHIETLLCFFFVI